MRLRSDVFACQGLDRHMVANTPMRLRQHRSLSPLETHRGPNAQCVSEWSASGEGVSEAFWTLLIDLRLRCRSVVLCIAQCEISKWRRCPASSAATVGSAHRGHSGSWPPLSAPHWESANARLVARHSEQPLQPVYSSSSSAKFSLSIRQLLWVLRVETLLQQRLRRLVITHCHQSVAERSLSF